MIPRILHYCWFGPNKPSALNEMCYRSWIKHLSGYQIVCWNESNSPMEHPYLKDAFNKRRYGFMIDYVRLHALYNHGGIFIDYDFLLLNNLDPLLEHDFFCGMMNAQDVGMGIVGCDHGNPSIKKLLNYYHKLDEFKDVPSTHIATNLFNKVGWDGFFNKTHGDVVFYPSEYFYSYPLGAAHRGEPYEKFLTEKSVAVHLWENTWIKPEFRHFWFGETLKGLRKAFHRIVTNPFQGKQYYRDLAYHLLRLMALK